MIIIGDGAARRLVSPRTALMAVEQAFRHVSRGSARNFPVVRERLLPGPDVYGIKSGFDVEAGILGLKIGGYWIGNAARGLTNHQSTTILTDPATGQPVALVSSNYLTGLRTAAASALSIRELARADARVLGVIGAGVQALYHIEAAGLVRDFGDVLIASRSEERAALCAAEAKYLIPNARIAGMEIVARSADVLITLTPSTQPVVQGTWIRPGTHICAMGTDTAGKQELETELVSAARVYVDDWQQASSIGECQHAARAGLLSEDRISGTLGDLLEGKAQGRLGADDITMFDSTGLAIQDLAVAGAALSAAHEPSEGIISFDLMG